MLFLTSVRDSNANKTILKLIDFGSASFEYKEIYGYT